MKPSKYFTASGGEAALRPALLALAAFATWTAGPALVAQPNQYSPPPSQYGPPPPAPSDQIRHLDQLNPIEQLTAPIALYPDPLVAIILASATQPYEVRASSHGWHEGDRPISPAVQDLTHYPELIGWMAANLDWTRQLGAAYAMRPREVMDGIQDLRQRALNAGTLQTNQQEQVIQDRGIVQIVPAQNDVVYLPRYNPDRVFFSAYGPSINWGAAEPAGPWLAFFPVWDRHEIWSGDWFQSRHPHGDDHHFNVGGFGISVGHGERRGPFGQPWHPAQDAPVFHERFAFNDGRYLARPYLMHGTPDYRPDQRPTFQGDDYRYHRDDDRNPPPRGYGDGSPNR